MNKASNYSHFQSDFQQNRGFNHVTIAGIKWHACPVLVKLRFILIFIFLFAILPSTMAQKGEGDSRNLIVKVKEGHFGEVASSINKIKGVRITHAIRGKASASPRLKNYYKIKVPGGSLALYKTLKSHPGIEQIEFEKSYKPLAVPNDPAAQPGAQQWTLENISAYDAWDLVPSSPNQIVTAIIDSGFDLSHEDLAENIFYNANDPVNGIDDDNDGYIDNYSGWDFGDDDNDPVSLTQSHGTMVAGAGFAEVNNSLGIAGTSFNLKFLPIKIYSTAENALVNEFDAIIYAAEHGAKVINLSWGNAGTYSQFEQDVIDYVAIDLDVVVVAAAGNTNGHLDFYPASYNHVLSVGAILQSDLKPSWSTYSDKIDIVAPGQDVYTTLPGNAYNNELGSSFASPLAAGTAALVRSIFPELNSQQVIEKIRMGADDIYSIPGNETYFGKLGKGRLNMNKALQSDPGPALRASLKSIPNSIYYGDTLKFKTGFINYLDPTSGVSVTLKSLDPNVTIISATTETGALSTLEESQEIDFEVVLSKATLPDEFLELYFEFDNDNYHDFQMLPFGTSPDYIRFDNNLITCTLNSTGEIGYLGDGYLTGEGFRIGGSELASHTGLIIGTDANHIASTTFNDLTNLTKDDDFQFSKYIKPQASPVADISFSTTYGEKTSSHSAGIQVTEKILGWLNAADQKYLIIQYRVANTAASQTDNLKVGLYMDWDLENYQQNKTGYDGANKLGYAYSSNQAAGIALLTDQNPFSRGIDLSSFNGNTQEINQVFDYTTKAQFINDGFTKTDAGVSGSGNDIAVLFGANIPSLQPKESTLVTFVISYGNSLSELQSNIVAAKVKYDEYKMNPPVLYSLTSCYDQPATIDPVDIDIFDLYQDVTLTNLIYHGNHYESSNLTDPAQYYIVPFENEIAGDSYAIDVSLETFVPQFNFMPETLILTPGEKGSILLNDISSSVSRNWDFGNGYFSSLHSPTADYFEPGEYTVTLEAIDQNGCSGSLSSQLVVLQRYPSPDVPAEVVICEGDTLTLSDQNKELNLYASLESSPVKTGTKLGIPNIIKDTLFYVTQTGSKPESLPASVSIHIDPVQTGFTYDLDTADISSATILNFHNSLPEFESSWYINDTLKSSGQDFQFDYSQDSSLNIIQINQSLAGCKDSLSMEIPLTKSNALPDQEIQVCNKSDYVIKPGIGNIFCFYSDMDLKHIIQKGSFLKLTNLESDSSIFVTSLDSLLPGDPARYDILISVPNASFSPQFDTLIYPLENQLQFQVEDSTLISYSWDFGEEGYSNVKEPLVKFSEPGIYPVKLEVTNELNCKSVQTGEITVFDITALAVQKENIYLYPNPVSENSFRVKAKDSFEISVFTSQGRRLNAEVIRENGYYDIELPAGIINGVYWVILAGQQKVLNLELVILK